MWHCITERVLVAVALAVALFACATPPRGDADTVADASVPDCDHAGLVRACNSNFPGYVLGRCLEDGGISCDEACNLTGGSVVVNVYGI